MLRTELPGKRKRGRAKMRFMDAAREDKARAEVTEEDAEDRTNWRWEIRYDGRSCKKKKTFTHPLVDQAERRHVSGLAPPVTLRWPCLQSLAPLSRSRVAPRHRCGTPRTRCSPSHQGHSCTAWVTHTMLFRRQHLHRVNQYK